MFAISRPTTHSLTAACRHRVLQCNRLFLTLLTGLLLLPTLASADWSLRGEWALQSQFFNAKPPHQAEQGFNTALSVKAELYRPVGENGVLFLNPFLRVDKYDKERSAFDLREAYYSTASGNWSFKAGLGEVFWGVTEFYNAVDVINQRDPLGDIGGREKFGQPMVNLLINQDWGAFDLYLLPGFRPKRFAGAGGRPRLPIGVDEDKAIYESDDAERHIDFAGRISRSMGPVDMGFHFFKGTSRDPLLQFNSQADAFVPYYFQTTQFGLDAQATFESWLLKLELARRNSAVRHPSSVATGGVEYSFYGILDTDADLGVVFEYVSDSLAQQALHPWQSDIFLATRLVLNDAQSTQAMVGVAVDLSGGGQFFQLEASRRISKNMKVSVDAYIWSNTSDDNALSQFDSEDTVQLQLSWFF